MQYGFHRQKKQKRQDINRVRFVGHQGKGVVFMNIYQKIILGIGAVVFVLVVAIYPVKYIKASRNEAYFFPSTTTTVHDQYAFVDIGATSLRGLAVVGATVATWAVAGKTKKKTD